MMLFYIIQYIKYCNIIEFDYDIMYQIDVSAAAAYVMCPKEDAEILTVKKACLVSVDVFTKYLKDQIMEIIDSDKVFLFIYYLFI